MCIFYGNKEDLTYDGREHIFPAAVGGIEKLPAGFVSDQANHYFSQLEQKMLHSSMISMSRMFFGPGKRGSDKVGEVQVSVFKADDGEYALGYIFKSKVWGKVIL